MVVSFTWIIQALKEPRYRLEGRALRLNIASTRCHSDYMGERTPPSVLAAPFPTPPNLDRSVYERHMGFKELRASSSRSTWSKHKSHCLAHHVLSSITILWCYLSLPFIRLGSKISARTQVLLSLDEPVLLPSELNILCQGHKSSKKELRCGSLPGPVLRVHRVICTLWFGGCQENVCINCLKYHHQEFIPLGKLLKN